MGPEDEELEEAPAVWWGPTVSDVELEELEYGFTVDP